MTTSPSAMSVLAAKIKETTKSIGRTHLDRRFCAFCGHGLTDIGSWEAGIGPVCNRKATRIYAKGIKADFSAVLMSVANVQPESLDATVRDVLSLIEAACVEAAEKSKAVDSCGADEDLSVGVDNRELAGHVCWLMGFRTSSGNKQALANVVKHLGFSAIANVLMGKASTGEASFSLDEATGQLVLVGSKCVEGMAVAYRLVPGVKRDKTAGKFTLRAPVRAYKAFIEVVQEYWPMHDCADTEVLMKRCEAYMATHPVVETSPLEQPRQQNNVDKQSYPAVFIKENNNPPNRFLHLKMDWVKGMSEAAVNKLKEGVNWKQRSFDALTKTWSILKTPANKDAINVAFENSGYTFVVDER